MNALLLLVLSAATDAAPASLPFAQSRFTADSGWTAQAPRAEIAPRAFVAEREPR